MNHEGQYRSVAFHTLGCKLNFSESSTLSRMLVQEGFVPVPFDQKASVYVINTCSVTEHADRKCRSVVRQALRRSPGAFVVVLGCYAQLKPAEIAAIPGVDLVLGAAEKFRLAEFLKDLSKNSSGEYHCGDIGQLDQFVPSWSQGDRTRTFLKVQDGCDYNCSFCTIPLARGRSRSERISGVLRRAEQLAREGVREIVLSGINLGDFGRGSGGQGAAGREAVQLSAAGREPARVQNQVKPRRQERFADLIRALDELELPLRYRISSIEPNLLDDEIIHLVAGSRSFVPHFHIPLQSGSNRILGLMKRRYRRELYASRVEQIRSLMPDAAIGVDVIVGFPGEGESEFEHTWRFLDELAVDYLHVFPYSERENTPAVDLPDAVDQGERMQRSRVLQSLSSKKRRALHLRCEGQIRAVLFEHADHNGEMQGFSDNYIKVRAPFDHLVAGSICRVELGGPDSEGLSSGRLLGKGSLIRPEIHQFHR